MKPPLLNLTIFIGAVVFGIFTVGFILYEGWMFIGMGLVSPMEEIYPVLLNIAILGLLIGSFICIFPVLVSAERYSKQMELAHVTPTRPPRSFFLKSGMYVSLLGGFPIWALLLFAAIALFNGRDFWGAVICLVFLLGFALTGAVGGLIAFAISWAFLSQAPKS